MNAMIGFTGHEGEEYLGWVNVMGRTYDPSLGRFLLVDPGVEDIFGYTGAEWVCLRPQ